MARGLRGWLLERLDSLLTEEQRRLPPGELSRYRVLVGVTGLLLLQNLFFALALPLYSPERRPVFGLLSLFAGAGYLLVLVLVRRRRSPRLPAFLLCASLAAAILLSTLLIDKSMVVVHASIMLVPALAVYLLGARLGFVFALVFCVDAGFFHLLFHTGFDLQHPRLADPQLWTTHIFAAVCVLFAWALGWLHSTARAEAHAQLEQALVTLRESEGELVSLIESTDDVVCSLDTEGRVLTANQAARQLLQRYSGRELVPGEPLLAVASPASQAHWRERLARAQTEGRMKDELPLRLGGETLTLEVTISPVRREDGRVVKLTVFGRDITERKRAEERLSELHRSLVDVSRVAGKAEIATGVLHNVGNTLNSVNVSTNLVIERLRGSHLPGLLKAVALLPEDAGRLGSFLTEDVRGRRLPVYLKALAEQLAQEREAVLAELGTLSESVEHIKSVVSMQQRHARSAGVMEQVAVSQLLDDALRLHAQSFERLGIQLRREYAELPPVVVDRHKLLQILVNLLSNARHALLESGRPDKELSLRVEVVGEERLRIAVADNGVGIAPESLRRLFTQGFTTRKQGHGFGLHISALAAEEMGGTLSCESAGPGQGATFLLELPRMSEEPQASVG